MANWIKLADDKKRELIADTLMEIENKYPFRYYEDFEVLYLCYTSIQNNTFDEVYFRALLNIPNGKNYWNIIRDIVLKGNIDERVIKNLKRRTCCNPMEGTHPQELK